MTQKNFNYLTWGIFAFAVLAPLIAWGSSYEWDIASLTALQWFGLFGLTAWMVMWTHYITGYFRIKNPNLKKPKHYGKLTAWLVLGCLLLHPGLLSYRLWTLTDQTPPDSWNNYVGDQYKLIIIIGVVALLIFLSFEVFDRLKDKPSIKKLWPAISISQSLAMTLIFVHGLQIGPRLQEGWFMIVWVICGLLLLPCFYAIHVADFSKK